jgi:hypothetical protein
MKNKNHEEIVRRFATIRARQFLAIALAVSLAIVIAVVFKRPDLFGVLSKKTSLLLLAVTMLAFVNFSSYNWRCPSCRKYLGNDIARNRCKSCGIKLQ